MKDILILVLAAGMSKRMKSKYPKVLMKILGRPMISYVIENVKKLRPDKITVVISPKIIQIKNMFSGVEFVLQHKQLGTGHAVLCAKEKLKNSENVLITYGDTPLISSNTLRKLINLHMKSDSIATLLTCDARDPTGYGRIIKRDGNIVGIIEESDATDEQKRIKEINSGVYCFKSKYLLEGLNNLKIQNVQGEYYLTDVISYLSEKGCKIESLKCDDEKEILGINTRVDLQNISNIIKIEILKKLMLLGVTIIDETNTFIDIDVNIGKDTIIYPFTIIEGKTKIGEDCIIGPNTIIKNSKIGKGVSIISSYVDEAKILDQCSIGPYSRIRPSSVIGKNTNVGNFVEIKNSKIGQFSQINHLSYIGDAIIGNKVNIGAGTITCNFDGVRKHKTNIKEGAFVGSNSTLVAPVCIGKGAYTGAGSTITKDVPDFSLGVGRGIQRNIERWVKRRMRC